MPANHIHQPFIVIGMHRSGTTMLAEAMNSAGIFMGVMRDHNSEAFHFLSLNQHMLWAANANWLNPVVPLPEHDKTLQPHAIFAEHIKSQSAKPARLSTQYRGAWGWKDPRNTFTLGLWLNRFPQAKVIHMVRDGRAVAMSLHTRNALAGEVKDNRLDDLAFCFNLWETYVAQGLEWEAKLRQSCLRLRFEDLAGHDDKAIQQLDVFTSNPVSRFVQNRSLALANYPERLNALAKRSNLFSALGFSL